MASHLREGSNSNEDASLRVAQVVEDYEQLSNWTLLAESAKPATGFVALGVERGNPCCFTAWPLNRRTESGVFWGEFFLQSTASMLGNSGTDARFPSRVRQNVVVG
jgi:hypothetical protein